MMDGLGDCIVVLSRGASLNRLADMRIGRFSIVNRITMGFPLNIAIKDGSARATNFLDTAIRRHRLIPRRAHDHGLVPGGGVLHPAGAVDRLPVVLVGRGRRRAGRAGARGAAARGGGRRAWCGA